LEKHDYRIQRLVNKIKEAHHRTKPIKSSWRPTKKSSKIKDVGGYVGGYLRAEEKPGKRGAPSNYDIDIDFAHLILGRLHNAI
jgi:hypothetical protein